MGVGARLRARGAGPILAVLLPGLAGAAAPSAAQDIPDASVESARLPAALECGKAFRASVTMRNTGATVWTSGDGLAAVDDEDAFTETVRVSIPPGREIAPGESHTFRFTLTAPDIPLPRARTAWRMVGADGARFGETAAQAVPVECPPRIDDAELVAADLPDKLACGQSYAARVVVRNTGRRRWVKGEGYVLGAVFGSEDFRVPARLALPGAGVVPEAEQTFTATLTAPAVAGTYALEWRMRSGAGWFGRPVARTVKVACAP